MCFAGDTDDLSAIMMASTICALIFDSTSEEALLQHSSFDKRLLNRLSQLIARSLTISGKVNCFSCLITHLSQKIRTFDVFICIILQTESDTGSGEFLYVSSQKQNFSKLTFFNAQVGLV